MNQSLVIDGAGDALVIRCPFWANDLLEPIPEKRWSKALRAWRVKVAKHNLIEVQKLMKMAGVQVTPAAHVVISEAQLSITRLSVKTQAGFPSWYRFRREPLPHQRLLLDRAYGYRCFALHWPMQVGKSKAAIDLCTAHHMEDHIRAVVVLTKRTLRNNWGDALRDDCPVPYATHLPETGNPDRMRRFMKEPKNAFRWYLIGWESLSQGSMSDLLREIIDVEAPTGVAIVGDETTYIAGHKSERAAVAVEVSKKAKYVYALTGTPALEGPMNLFSQYKFLNPNIIGIDDFLAFRNRYAIMGGYQREVAPGKKVATQIVGYRNLDELMKAIAPFTDEVDKVKALKLPPKRTTKFMVELTKELRAAYEHVRKEGVIKAAKGEPDHVIQNCLELELRLHQIAGGYAVKAREERRIGADGKPKVRMVYDPVQLVKPEANPKMIEVAQFIEEIRHKSQFLLWAQYAPEIEGLRWWLRKMGLRIGELHGGVPDAERQPMVRAFREGHLDCVLGNPGTGGMGYTMMTAEYNLFYNNSNKAIDRVQAEDRNYGQGQTKSPVVVDFLAEKTVDKVRYAALERKLDLAEYLKLRLREVLAGDLFNGEV
jgi:hypothetical protein